MTLDLLTKRSLDNIEFIQPTADKGFTLERGLAILRAVNIPHQAGLVYKL